MDDSSQNTKDESFNIKPYALKALQYWYLFVIALIVSSGYAWYKVRYSIPIYKVDARMAIKDEYTSWGQEYFLPGMELVSTRNRLVNEIGFIRSFPLMRKVIEELPDFRVWYYDIGNIKSTELYKSSPFIVQWDSIQDVSIFGKAIYLKILSPQKFVVGDKQDAELDGKKFYFGEPFALNKNNLTITLRDSYSYEFFKDKLYRFTINDPDGMAISYQGGLGISTEEKESSILIISRQGTEIQKEIDFINKFLEVYIQDGLERNNQVATNVMQFVDNQINEILNTLIISENKLENFQSRINFNRIDLEGEKLIPEITQLEKKKLDLEFDINYYKQILEYIQNNDDSKGIIVPSFITSNNVLFRLLEGLISAYTKKMKLSYDVTTSNDAWKQLNDEIKVSKRIIIENLKSTLEREKNDFDNINKQIEFIESKMKDVPSAEREYFNIQRDYKLNNDLYTFLLKKRAEASIAKGSNVPQAQVLDFATPYRVSFVGPNISKIYNTSIILGLVIAGIIVFLAEYFNEKIVNKKDLDDCTKIPVLAIVGHNRENNNLVVANQPKSVISESFRSMRTNINYLVAGKERFSVLITSSAGGEGKTFCSINLASAFALLGKKTVILGADLRKPKKFRDFGLKSDKGISNFIIGKAGLNEIIQSTNYDNIDIILAGHVPPNPSELLSSKNMKNLFTELRGMYDVIIIDTPPIGLVTDSLLLTEYSDVILYVVRHNFTKKGQLSLVNKYYKDKKLQNTFIILNDLKQSIIGYWGSNGFDSSYSYSYDGEDEQKKRSIFSRLISFSK